MRPHADERCPDAPEGADDRHDPAYTCGWYCRACMADLQWDDEPEETSRGG